MTKFPAVYGNRRSIAMLAKIPTLTPILSQMKPLYTLRSYSYKIHFNITLPLNPCTWYDVTRFAKWIEFISVKFCYQIPTLNSEPTLASLPSPSFFSISNDPVVHQLRMWADGVRSSVQYRFKCIGISNRG